MNRGKSKNAGGSKSWVHPPEALLRGHIVYNCKFYGHTEVDEPKGSPVVKDAITKLKFNKQIKRAEGQKPPKVELTVSVDGVTIQEPKYKVMQHKFPLHRISYCADDKSDKRIFTFIAKESDSNKHHCFVFDSEKCAEEITLTIGQAFDLAYKKFLESSRGDMNQKKQDLLLQKKVQTLTQENLQLKARVADLERLVDPKVLEELDKNRANAAPTKPTEVPVVGRRLENLIFDEQNQQNKAQHTNGTSSVPALAPPPPIPARTSLGQTTPTAPPTGQRGATVDLFGAPPFNPNTAASPTTAPPSAPPVVTSPTNPFAPKSASDPFGMPAFNPNTATPAELDQQIQKVDMELLDLQMWQDAWPWNYLTESLRNQNNNNIRTEESMETYSNVVHGNETRYLDDQIQDGCSDDEDCEVTFTLVAHAPNYSVDAITGHHGNGR